LGDLSGGQILKKIAQTAMNLSDGVGTAFYEFAAIPDEKAFKNKYRQAMNDLPADEATIERIVDEANDAFGMNMKMFQELETSFTRILVKLVSNWFSSMFQPLATKV
jgi:heme oxygenase